MIIMKGGKDTMELGQRIKMYRSEKFLSQESLAERVYVSRQTISNWENGKSYPDINSLILLSEVFETTLDNLIKGDVEKMKMKINTEEVKKLNFCGVMMLVFMVPAVILVIPLAKLIGLYALIPFFILWMFGMSFAIKAEKIKKNNDVQTYKEIVAFMEGKKLDEIKQIEEKAKRPYQKMLLAIISAVIVIIVCGVMALIF